MCVVVLLNERDLFIGLVFFQNLLLHAALEKVEDIRYALLQLLRDLLDIERLFLLFH